MTTLNTKQIPVVVSRTYHEVYKVAVSASFTVEVGDEFSEDDAKEEAVSIFKSVIERAALLASDEDAKILRSFGDVEAYGLDKVKRWN